MTQKGSSAGANNIHPFGLFKQTTKTHNHALFLTYHFQPNFLSLM